MFGKALRRSIFEPDDELPMFHARSGELRAGSRAVRLEPKAAAVLGHLREADGEIVGREELLDLCWQPGAGSDEALTQAIAQIRRGFAELGIPSAVETLAKRGYRLTIEVQSSEGPTARLERLPARSAPLFLAAAIAIAVLAIAYSHPVRHAVRHALGLGPPAQTGSMDHHAR